MDVLILGAGMAFALVVAVAGIAKLLYRPRSEKALVDFGVSLPFARPIATVLP
jgi:hypothetical protein